MPIRPKKRSLSSGVIAAAGELGEQNPLKKAADAIRDSGQPAPPVANKGSNVGRVRQAFKDRFPHTGQGMGDVRTTPTPIRKSGFGGVTRKDSPSKRKMRNRGPRNS